MVPDHPCVPGLERPVLLSEYAKLTGVREDDVLAIIGQTKIPSRYYHGQWFVEAPIEREVSPHDNPKKLRSLDDPTWERLCRRIRDGKCTPFLGAGASFPTLPLGSSIAAAWAQECEYPGDNPKNLVEVAQYLAEIEDPLYPKKKILKEFDGVAPPDFNAPDEPHGVLADLPFPVYLTTNYDDFMVRALKSRGREPHREFCRWNSLIKNEPSIFDEVDEDRYVVPTVANPLVFHLHGHTIPQSIVLTEDDYLCFLANIRDDTLLPPRIQAALSSTTLLFIGYRGADWTFRVLLQGLSMDPRESIMYLTPERDFQMSAVTRALYLAKYYERMSAKIYFGTAWEFAGQLREHWDAREF